MYVEFDRGAVAGPKHDASADARLYVHFHPQEVLDPVASKEAGRPIFVEREFIRIGIPGDKGNMPDLPVNQSHKDRFPQQYAAFKANRDQGEAAGTPLKLLAHTAPPLLTLGQVAEFAHFNVLTAEQLVSMPDAIAQKFMGIHDLQRRVQTWMDVTKAKAPDERLRSALETRDAQIATLTEQVEELMRLAKEQRAELESRKALPAETPKPVQPQTQKGGGNR